MPSEWFYAVDGSKHGPVSSKELTDLARSGKLPPTALVWKEGMDGWKPAGKVKGLFPAAATAPSPPTTPPAPASPPDIASAAKGLFGAVAGAAKRIGSKVAEAAKQPAETVGTDQEAKSGQRTPDEYPPQPDTPAQQTAFPKLSRRTAVVAGVAGGGAMLLSCIVCGAIGSLFNGSTDGASKGGSDKSRAGGNLDMTVDEFRKAIMFTNGWCPKQKFFDEFGKPTRISTIGDYTYLYYQCKDGTARIECGKGEYQYQDTIRPLGVDEG